MQIGIWIQLQSFSTIPALYFTLKPHVSYLVLTPFLGEVLHLWCLNNVLSQLNIEVMLIKLDVSL